MTLLARHSVQAGNQRSSNSPRIAERFWWLAAAPGLFTRGSSKWRSDKLANQFAIFDIPDAYLAIPRTAGDTVPIGTHGDGKNSVAVSFEGSDLGTTVGIPEAHRPVYRARDEQRPGWMETNLLDKIGVPASGADLFRVAGKVPEPDLPIPTATHADFAIRMDGNARDIFLMPWKSSKWFLSG